LLQEEISLVPLAPPRFSAISSSALETIIGFKPMPYLSFTTFSDK